MPSPDGVVASQLSSSDPAVVADHPSGRQARDRGPSRSRRAFARAATTARQVWRSWLSVAFGAVAVSACAAPTENDESTRATEARLSDGADVTIAAILAKLQTCHAASHAAFATDSGESSTINICRLKNAVFFKADFDVDCDGKKSAQCNSTTDHSWQDQTAASDSLGKPLDAAAVPYVVVPGLSSRWSFENSGIALGSVAAVIYNGKLEFGVVGDIGPKAIIGEGSYAMADALGINPNPSTGGVDSGVTYILFSGDSGILTRNEDHDEAVAIGMQRAAQLIAEN